MGAPGADLRLRLATALVRDHMTPDPLICRPTTPIAEVARQMAERRIHFVVIEEDPGYGEGPESRWAIVSDADLVEAIASDRAADTARDVALMPLATIGTHETVLRAAELMADHGVSHLMVADAASGRPAGVLSALDLARVIGGPAPPGAGAAEGREETASGHEAPHRAGGPQ
jgi:CBS domain-containing protein